MIKHDIILKSMANIVVPAGILFLVNSCQSINKSERFQPDAHTVLLLHFDENEGLPQDSSGSGAKALRNTAKWIKHGKFGSALHFDGKNSLVEIPDSAPLNVKDGEITVEAWVKPEAYRGSYPGIISKYSTKGGYLLTLLGSDDYCASFFLRHDEDNFTNDGSDAPLPLNEWSHVAGVRYRDGTMKLFVNGVAQPDQGKFAMSFGSEGTSLFIGNYHGEGFIGAIDEVRISTIARYKENEAAAWANSATEQTKNVFKNAGFMLTPDPDVQDLPDRWFCSDSPFMYPDWPECWKLVSDHFVNRTKSIRLIGRNNRTIGAVQWNHFVGTNMHTFSVYLKSETEGMPATLDIDRQEETVTVGREWRRYSISKEIKESEGGLKRVGVIVKSNGVLWVNAPQLERGNVATAFAPSPFDLPLKKPTTVLQKIKAAAEPESTNEIPATCFLDKSFYTTEKSSMLLVKYAPDKNSSTGDVVKISLAAENGGTVIENMVCPLKSSRNEIPLDIQALKPAVYQLSAELTVMGQNGSLSVIKKTIPLIKAPASVTALKIDCEKQVFLSGNEPWIAFVAVPEYLAASREMLADIKLHGFNTALVHLGEEEYERMQEWLDLAQQHGIKVIIWLRSARPGEKYDDLKKLDIAAVNRFKDHTAVLAWYFLDEPEGWWTAQKVGEESDILELYRSIKKADPYHPALVNHYKKWPRGRGQYGGNEASDIYSADIYTIHCIMGEKKFSRRCGQPAMQAVADYVRDMEYDGGRDGKPLSVILQFANAYAWRPYFLREVTPSEAKCLTYLSLIRGARMIMYYDRKPMSQYLWESMRALGHEVEELTGALVSRDRSDSVSADDEAVHFAMKGSSGKLWLIAVNSSEKPATCVFSFKDGIVGAIGKADVLFENRKVDWKDSKLTDWFAPYERHVYCLK